MSTGYLFLLFIYHYCVYLPLLCIWIVLGYHVMVNKDDWLQVMRQKQNEAETIYTYNEIFSWLRLADLRSATVYRPRCRTPVQRHLCPGRPLPRDAWRHRIVVLGGPWRHHPGLVTSCWDGESVARWGTGWRLASFVDAGRNRIDRRGWSKTRQTVCLTSARDRRQRQPVRNVHQLSNLQ